MNLCRPLHQLDLNSLFTQAVGPRCGETASRDLCSNFSVQPCCNSTLGFFTDGLMQNNVCCRGLVPSSIVALGLVFATLMLTLPWMASCAYPVLSWMGL